MGKTFKLLKEIAKGLAILLIAEREKQGEYSGERRKFTKAANDIRILLDGK